MQKDFKIGMGLGMALVAVAALWLATRPSLSTKSRMLGIQLHSRNVPSLQETYPEQPGSGQNLSNTLTAETAPGPDFTLHEQTENRESNEKLGTSYGPPTTRFHIVRKGETLSEISLRYYGSANKWQKILDANRKTIKDANKLAPGTKLTIPE